MAAVPSVTLDPARWRAGLSDICRTVAKTSGPLIVCLSGPAGAGKTTLGREIRKKGLPGYARGQLALIDDGVMSVPLLGIFTRRIRDKSGARDNLAAFSRWTRGKSVLVYVAIRPWDRLDSCDVLLQVRCSEAERARRQSIRGKNYRAGTVDPPENWVDGARVLELAME